MRRRERKRPPKTPRCDERKSYMVSFKTESKNALVAYLKSWLEFDCTTELIMYNSHRILTLHTFKKENPNVTFKMLVIRNNGLQFFKKFCERCKTESHIHQTLHTVFKTLMPHYYDEIQYLLRDFAAFLMLRDWKEIESDRCICILFRVEYFTLKTICEYLTDVALTKTDESVLKCQVGE